MSGVTLKFELNLRSDLVLSAICRISSAGILHIADVVVVEFV